MTRRPSVVYAAAATASWPRRSWWAGTSIALAGAVLLVSFRDGGSLAAASAGLTGDLLIFAGIGFCGLGYAAARAAKARRAEPAG